MFSYEKNWAEARCVIKNYLGHPNINSISQIKVKEEIIKPHSLWTTKTEIGGKVSIPTKFYILLPQGNGLKWNKRGKGAF